MYTIDTAAIPTEEPSRREWIKYQLRVRGSSLSAVARDQGVSRFATSLALQRPYPRIERAIARRLGLEPKQVWPERYDTDGRTKKPASKDTSRTQRRNVHVRGGA